VYAMPPYAIDAEAGEWLVRGALAALDATFDEVPA